MIRPSLECDSDAIRKLIDAAFAPSQYESRLREIVVRQNYLHSEWVVEQDSQITAHILYTSATHENSIIGYHLAPVAVHPDFQNEGIGTMLVRETLSLDPICNGSVFVLGDPEFYERFGFTRPVSARCPFDNNNEHFRALRWVDSEEPFTVGYSPAFEKADPNA
ncbi:N-acetyltransferase [Verrucomicrobiales bacterium]|nr:N-acetyltransferase [Verrucomicrobiales bacterium]